MQKILIMNTAGFSLRHPVIGWTAEDGDNILLHQSIGYSRSYQGNYRFETPMHAIGAGWKLLAPPTEIKTEMGPSQYEWWFTRED